MKINSIQLNNFKCYDDKLMAVGSRIDISGRNGSGKSSIREAILFALYNKTETAVKETDKYIKNGTDFCEVVLNTNVGIITRQRSKSKSKLWFNNTETTQESLVEALRLPSFEVFNSVFTAGYFMCLPEKDQRQLILDLTEPVDRQNIYNKLGGKITSLGAIDIDLDDLDGTYKKINALKKAQQSLEIDRGSEVGALILSNETCSLCGATIKDKKKIERKLEVAKKTMDDAIIAQVQAKDILDILKKIPQEEIKIKLEFLGPKLNEYIPDSEIVLMELLKSAIGYKPVFKLYVNDKEYRFLSTGEKKSVDVGICEFLNNYYKLDMMFIDNMESISNKLPINFKQIFTSKVVDDELKVVII